jgi:hypothetical protein
MSSAGLAPEPVCVGSQLTRRWGKPDSNSQSHPRERLSFGDKPTQIPKATGLTTMPVPAWTS